MRKYNTKSDTVYYKLIQSTRWLHLRKWKLQEDPLCERCKQYGIVTAATQVHHIKPLERKLPPALREQLCYDYSNLMSVCQECHDYLHMQLRSHDPSRAQAARRQTTAAMIAKLFGPTKPDGKEGV